jgi:8-oxo-dGTP pyrophosphatase MutT (NUDIX family)
LGPYRSAAVLIPVTRLSDNAESHVVLTVRSADLKSHPGQISFPGGTVEKQDKDSVATALRETQEEIGVHPNNVEVIGRISDIALPSGYRVTPVVGILDNNLDYLANPAEVETIFHAPLSLLLDPKAYKRSAVAYQDVERAVLELHYEEYRIWGATAAILYHLASHI